MSVRLEDLNALAADVLDAVERAKVLRDAAYRLSILSLRSDLYASDPDFREATDDVLDHFGLRPRKD